MFLNRKTCINIIHHILTNNWATLHLLQPHTWNWFSFSSFFSICWSAANQIDRVSESMNSGTVWFITRCESKFYHWFLERSLTCGWMEGEDLQHTGSLLLKRETVCTCAHACILCFVWVHVCRAQALMMSFLSNLLRVRSFRPRTLLSDKSNILYIQYVKHIETSFFVVMEKHQNLNSYKINGDGMLKAHFTIFRQLHILGPP